MATSEPWTYHYRSPILTPTWGVVVWLTALARHGDQPPEDATRVGARTFLEVAVDLPEDDVAQLRLGLERVVSLIEASSHSNAIVIRVEGATFALTDYQPEGMAAAIVGWCAEEFGFTPPRIEVDFDTTRNRYVFEIT